jgi:hypothetical protein
MGKTVMQEVGEFLEARAAVLARDAQELYANAEHQAADARNFVAGEFQCLAEIIEHHLTLRGLHAPTATTTETKPQGDG